MLQWVWLWLTFWKICEIGLGLRGKHRRREMRMMVNAKMKERTDEKGMEGVCDDVDKAEIQINK